MPSVKNACGCRLPERPSSTIFLLVGNHSTHWYTVLFVAHYYQYCANCALNLWPQKCCNSTLHSNVPIRSRTHIFTVKTAEIWIMRGQLDATSFIISLFNSQHVSDVNTSILRSLRLICWVISWVVLLWFDVCWCYIVVWLWWCGIRMQASACIRIPHHPSQNTT